MQYPAVITQEGEYVLAEFPDCPGCQTFVEEGESIDAAAQEALDGWLESNLGRDLVPPRPFSDARAQDGEVRLIPIEPLLAVRLDFRWARDDAALTQSRLAQKIGMSQQQLAKLEAGGNPTLSTLSRVAEGLGRRVVVSLEKAYDVKPNNFFVHGRPAGVSRVAKGNSQVAGHSDRAERSARSGRFAEKSSVSTSRKSAKGRGGKKH